MSSPNQPTHWTSHLVHAGVGLVLLTIALQWFTSTIEQHWVSLACIAGVLLLGAGISAWVWLSKKRY